MAGERGKLVLFSAIYTSLPAVSFLSVPVVGVLSGASVLSAEAGVAVMAKVVVTMSVAGALIRRAACREKNA